MTDEMSELLLSYLKKDIPHLVLNLQPVMAADESVCVKIAEIQQQFYEQNCSCVICNLQPAVEKILKDMDLLEQMNITNSESEAWDIVQMEEIERELLNGEWD